MAWLVHVSFGTAFVPMATSRVGIPTSCSSSNLFQSQSNKNSIETGSAAAASFELSELKLNLRSMEAQKLTTANQIEPSKRVEIEGYIRKVVNRRDCSIPLWELGQYLPGTTWRLNFSTHGVTNQSLPAGASIVLKFQSQQEQRRLEYCLEFTKTLGLSKLTAVSTYDVDTTPIHPGWVTYTYQDIQTDLFGLRGLSIPIVGGMLKGRSTILQTVYFDGQVWIEKGNSEEAEYFQVYTRQVDDEEDESWQS